MVKQDGFYLDIRETDVESEEFFNLLNEIMDTDSIPSLISFLKKQGIFEIRFLKNFEVDKDRRGTGLGSQVIAGVLNKGPIILQCDNLETQEKGFVLESFYIKRGFEIIPFSGPSGPFMLKL